MNTNVNSRAEEFVRYHVGRMRKHAGSLKYDLMIHVKEQNMKKDVGSITLRVLGWLGVAGWLILVVVAIQKGSQPRFQTDNAIGATANALESINYTLMCWLNFFGAMVFFALATLRDIRLEAAATTSLLNANYRGASFRAAQSSPLGASQCPNCHEPLAPGTRFCVKCGAKI